MPWSEMDGPDNKWQNAGVKGRHDLASCTRRHYTTPKSKRMMHEIDLLNSMRTSKHTCCSLQNARKMTSSEKEETISIDPRGTAARRGASGKHV
jgi:hypothetical protein